MWAGAFAEALLDDLVMVWAAYELNDQSPLGSAAGYGVPLPLDREYAAELMGFAKVQNNALYCQNSRGKIESAVLAAVNAVMFDVGKFATDVLIFSTAEFGYFGVANELRTGSSIMPQKRNVDLAELLRSKVHLTTGLYTQVIGVGSSLMSGYNRDLQDSKKPLMEGLDLGLSSVQVAGLLVAGLTPNAEAMRAALTPEIFATHRVLDLVKQGKSFREAYQEVGAAPFADAGDVDGMLRRSGPTGSTSNLQLPELRKAVAKEYQRHTKAREQFEVTIQALLAE
jgi:argininosuccinate lyase